MLDRTRLIHETNPAPRFAFPLVMVFLLAAMAFVGSSLTDALDSISRDLPVTIAPPN